MTKMNIIRQSGTEYDTDDVSLKSSNRGSADGIDSSLFALSAD